MEFGLTKHVTQPTCGDRLLDVVASEDAIPVRNVLVSDSVGVSDHRLITAEVQLPLQIKSSVRCLTRCNFSKFDTLRFESILLSSELYTSPETEVDNFVDQLERVVTSALDAVCPEKTRRVRVSHRRRPPLSAEATMAKRRRRRLERRWKRSGRDSDKEDFRRCCRNTNRLINESRRQLVSSRLDQCVNARQRWSTVRQLLHDDNQLACKIDDPSFCNTFANYFVSKIDSLKSAIASQLIHTTPPPPDPVCPYPSMQLLEPVTSLEVSKLLSTIPPKTCCLDYIPTVIIKQCSFIFSDLIAYLANLSFSQGTFPSKFKHASVTPVLKKPGLDSTVSANYRPISNLNNVSKILERLFLTRLQPHITISSNFNPLQSAYRKHHSTETSLVHLLDSIYHAADNGLATLLLSLDLSAAFDTIDHAILLNRLTSSFGIIGSSHNWLKSYLSNRSFSVTSGSISSAILPSPCGVPQGSVLGPILFTVYVSPLASIISSHNVNQQQYADDIQLFLFLAPASVSSSLSSLQRCVSSLHSWFLHNGLVLNPTKTEAICFGTNPRLKSLRNLTSIEVSTTSVPLSNHVKLLGVTFDSHLNFDKHISNVCSSSYFHIRALRHIRPYLDCETSKTIACAIVGSRLDYANSVFAGISSRNIHRLQRVQNSLAKVVTRSTTNSSSALNSLHWLPIAQRIDYKLATLVHHSLHNTCPLYLSSLLHSYTPSRHLRSSSLNLLSQPRTNTVLASRGFRSAGPSIWNSLPPHLRSIDSYSTFKSQLKTHLFSAASISGP